MRMHAEDARRNGWTGRDGLREGGQRGKGEGGRVGGAGREVRVAREIRREGGGNFNIIMDGCDPNNNNRQRDPN